MPSSLSKVQKHVTKKKGPIKLKSLNENSRDAQRIRRAGARDDRVQRQQKWKKNANRAWLERVAFFQDNLPETLHPFELPQLQSLIVEYISRHNEEMETCKAERRQGRPASTRQKALEQFIETERQEYESGFWMPDLQDEVSLVKLDKWGGDWISLGNLRWVRVDRSGDIKESAFPPRGAS